MCSPNLDTCPQVSPCCKLDRWWLLFWLQVDLDQLDQNKAVNKAGAIVGSFKAATNSKISDTALQPYDEVFGLQRFRETELIHGR